MKFTVNRKELLEALTLTGRAINKSIVSAIMGYRFDIDGNRLTITGGNMETYIYNTIEIDGGFTKSIIVPKEKVYNLLRELPDPQLEFVISVAFIESVEAIKLIINAQSGKYTIPVENGDDYPGIVTEPILNFKIQPDELVKGLDKTIFACASDHAKLSLQCIFLSIKHGKAIYVACNGSIMSAHRISDADEEMSHELLLPRNTANILKDLPFEDDVTVEVSKNAIIFKLWDGLEVCSTLIDDKFPDYKQIIPTENTRHMHIDRLQLISSIRRVVMFANDNYNSIALHFTPNELRLITSNDLDGNALEVLPADYAGEPVTFGFNGKQLLSILDRIDADVVYADFSEINKPVLFHDGTVDVKDKENLMLVMPVLLPPNLAKVS